MFQFIPRRSGSVRLFIACLLAYTLLSTPLASLAASRNLSVSFKASPTQTAPSATEVRTAAKSSVSSTSVPNAVLLPTLTASKVDALFTDVDGDTQADPGDTLEYTVTIQNSVDPANNVVFTDTIDTHTTLVPGSVNSSPIAFDDPGYAATGNVRISVNAASGVLANDVDPDSGTNAGLTASAGVTSVNGGNVVMNADGSFTYNPSPGFTGTDTFNYTVTDGSGATGTGTVTFNVSGMIWFVNAAAGGGGDGRLTSPFNCLVGAGCYSGSANDPGDNIFLYSGAYTGGLTLKANQRFIGQGASASISAITGLTPPAGSDPLPATGGVNPTITTVAASTDAITLASGNTLRGFTIGNTTDSDIAGTSFGQLTISEVTLNGTGRALDLNTGTFAAGSSITSVTVTSSATQGMLLQNLTGANGLAISGTSITNAASQGIQIANSSAALSFGATTITNPGAFGIDIQDSSSAITFGDTGVTLSANTGVFIDDSTSAVTFADLDINPDPGQRALHITDHATGTITATSGTITTTTGTAVEITGASTTPLALSLTQVNVNGAPSGIVIQNNSGSFTVNGDGSTTSGILDRDGSGGALTNTTSDAVRLTNANNVTLKQMNLNSPGDTIFPNLEDNEGSTGEHGVEANGGSNIILSGVLIDSPSASGMIALNLTGTNRINNNSLITNIDNPATHGLYIVNNTGFNLTLFEVNDTDFTNSSSGAATVNFRNSGTANMTVEIRNGCIFEALSSQAVTADAGLNVGTTGTVTSLITGNTFRNANGVSENNVAALVANGAAQNATISNNIFDNIAEDGTVANTSVIRTQNSGGRFTAVVLGNTIRNINYGVGAGGRHMIGHVYEPAAYTASHFSDLRFESNVATNNITFSNTNREFIFIDYRANASNGDVKILNNTWTMPTAAATSESVELRFRQENPSTVNVQVANNNGSAGNMDTRFFNVDVEERATANLTFTNNTFTNTGGGIPGPTLDLATEDNVAVGDASACFNLSGNILSPNTITLNEALNTNMTVTQASQAALSGANGGAAVTLLGTPTFGAPPCTLPDNALLTLPESNRLNHALATVTAEKDLSSVAAAVTAGELGKASTTSAQNSTSSLVRRHSHHAVSKIKRAYQAISNWTSSSTPMMLAGETVTVNGSGSGFTLPAGKSTTIKFRVTVNNPPDLTLLNPARVSNQGTVSGSNFTSVLTDDPAVGGAADPTETLIDLFDSQTAVATSSPSIVQGDSVTFTATVTPVSSGPTPVTGTVDFFDGTAIPANLIAGCDDRPLSGSPAQATCTTSALTAAGSPHTITARYNADGGNYDASSGTVSQTVILVPDLTIDKQHTGAFFQGQAGATYTITVTNSGNGAMPTGQTISVTDTLPDGLTATAMTGTGWTCAPTAPPNTFPVSGPTTISCARTGDTLLAAAASYPAITLTVTVDNDATTGNPGVTNSASVTQGAGGEVNTGNNSDTDPTAINAGVDLTIDKSHTDIFTQGDTGKTYTITVTNSGGTASSGTVTVTDTLPSGLTATGFTGTNWTCAALPALSCTRNDSLAPTNSYEPITLTVDVDSNAPNSVDNVANVSVTGDVNNGNNSDTDQTNIASLGYEVNSLGDEADINVGDAICDTDVAAGSQCTLRAAIEESNASTGTDDTIIFDPALNGGTITLNTILPQISDELVIDGPGASLLTVQRNPAAPDFRVFWISISLSGSATVRGLTISGGKTSGAALLSNSGGTVNIENCVMSGNATDTNGGGGAVNNNSVAGTINIINSTISGNTASMGGGISNSHGTLNVIGSTITGNLTDASIGNGGGIYNLNGAVTIINSTISGNNTSQNGGGIFNSDSGATLTVINSTVTDNHADSDNNSSGTGGAIYRNNGTVTLHNSIIAGNFNEDGGSDAADDIAGTGPVDTASSFNLIGTGGSGGLTNGVNSNHVGVADARLGPLASNGGPTQTHALLAGSLALDAGNNANLPADTFDLDGDLDTTEPVPFDQRGTGFARVLDSGDASTTQTVDMGAFEARASVEEITDKSTPEATLLSFSFNVGDGALITNVTATSGNTTLVPNANLSITGSGSTRTLDITPAGDEIGTAVITVTVTSGSESMTDTFTLTVTGVAEAPGVTAATTSEDTQTSSGLVISRGAPDGAEITHFKITGITNGTLFKNDGVTAIADASFITFAEGNAGLKFTPAANLFSPGSTFTFTVQGATDGSGTGLGAGTAATITVSPVGDTPSVTNATTDEDTQSTTGLVISRNVVDGVEVTHFKITNITGGTLFKNDGTTQINNNDFITFAEGNAGLKFTPAADSNTAGSFQVQAATDGIGTGLSAGFATATITINPVADTPSVTDATTSINTQTTSGLVISRNVVDGPEVTHFKITNINNGTLFQNDGTTAINSGDFITFTEGNAGLKFTPGAGLSSPGSTFGFDIQASTTNNDGGLDGGLITASITVTPSLGLIVNTLGDAADLALDGVCDTDAAPGDQCTLRAAIQETNNAASADTIDFSLPASSTIELTSALPAIAGDLEINGPTNGLTIDGNSTGRVFSVASGTVSINTLAVTGGSVNGGHGGGLLVTGGDVTVKDMLFTANTVVNGNGGAIAVTGGVLSILNTTISGNTATNGGGVYNGGGGLTVINVTVTNNTANGDTGSGPTAAGDGGGLHIGSNPTLVRNSIVAGNIATTNAEVSGTLGLGGNNLLSGNPVLAPLANNGGPTMTHALLAGSPALDAGDDTQATNAGLINDQRGFDRITDGNGDAGDTVDIGAFEAQVWLEDIADRAIDEDGSDSFSFNVGGAAAITNVTATSSNTAVVPNLPAALAISGAGGTRTLTITPAVNAFGTTTITVTVESASGSMSDTFLFTVNPVNDPPIFTGGPNQSVSEDAGSQTIPNWATGISPGPANESTQTLTFLVSNGNNSLFLVQPAIAPNGTLTFTPAANTSGVATVSVQLQDNGGGTDTTPFPPYQFTITVNAVNDAPVLDNTGNMTLAAINEDIAPASNTGTLVADIIASAGGDRITDADAGALEGIAVIGVDNTNGTWEFSTNGGGLWTAFGSPSTFSARLLAADANTRIRFLPNANFNGTVNPGITFQAWDQTSGANGGTVNTSINGGSSAFSTATETASITVNAVNDAPTANGQNVNTNEDTPLPITLTGTDVETTSANLTYTVTVQPTNGVLSGTGANLTYTPNADFNGADSFKFTVTDSGDGSSPALTSAEATVNITVNAVNDGPVNTVPGAQSVTENSTLTFSAGNGNQIAIADVDAGAPGVQVTLTATNGTITLAGTAGLAFTVGDGTADGTMTFTGTVAAINTALNGLVFTPTSGFDGAASLQIVTNDLGNTGSGGALSDSDTVNVTVNDGGALQFSSATYSVNEDAGTATIRVNRTGGTAGTTTVDFTTSNGTATAGVSDDYLTSSGTLTFGPGDTSQTFTVTINEDSNNEPDETVNLTLSNVTGSGSLGSPSTAVLTIVDNDPGGSLQFSSATYSVSESGGSIIITVERVGGSNGTAFVDFATSDGSATAGSDYTATSGTLTFGNGVTSQTFTVPILPDTVDEPNETVNLTLSNVSGTGNLGSPSTAVLTITDNDPPTFSLDASTYTVDEDDLRVSVTVNRGGDLSQAVKVDYASSDPSGLNECSQITGNASQRCDYATVVGTLRFAAGESSKVIHIPIVDDVYIEGAETFTITLSNESGGELATPATATVTINDNDVGPATNPIDNDAFWLRQMYIDILGREPEPGAVNAWLAILNNCTPATNCDRTAVALGFLKSVEFQGRGFFAYRFYAASLGRPSLYSEFVPDHARFSGFLSPAELELNKQDYVNEFMNRAEFKAIYDPTIGNNTLYVDTLLQRAGLPNHPQRTAWINGLNAATLTRADVLRQLVDSNEVYFRFLNEGFVVMNYFGLLRRSADAQYLVWIQILNQTGDERGIVTGFINSPEYRLRFGPN